MINYQTALTAGLRKKQVSKKIAYILTCEQPSSFSLSSHCPLVFASSCTYQSLHTVCFLEEYPKSSKGVKNWACARGNNVCGEKCWSKNPNRGPSCVLTPSCERYYRAAGSRCANAISCLSTATDQRRQKKNMPPILHSLTQVYHTVTCFLWTVSRASTPRDLSPRSPVGSSRASTAGRLGCS